MSQLQESIETIILAVDFTAVSLSVEADKDCIFDTEGALLNSNFVAQYQLLLTQLAADSYSRVLVTTADQLALFPESCVVVPTLGEAEDLIEMDRIQRDLGF